MATDRDPPHCAPIHHATPRGVSIVPTKISFRDCVHHGIAGPTAQHILASIRAEYCLAPSERARADLGNARVAMQVEDYPALERALGASAFRQLLADFHRRLATSDGLAALPDYLAQHRYGATSALLDLARLEHALAVSARAPSIDSVGPCCLPLEMLHTHLDLTLTFHPAWRLLELTTPADQWRQALLGQDARLRAPARAVTRLRIAPEAEQAIVRRLTPAEFAFEHALLTGGTLRQAIVQAQAHAISFDPYRAMQTLLMAGAVVDFTLHPATLASNR